MVSTQIVKLYLYNNEHALALSHHSTHIRHFGDFSRGWGIGEETFEYWSWIARQYVVFSLFVLRESLKFPPDIVFLQNYWNRERDRHLRFQFTNLHRPIRIFRNHNRI